MQAVDFNPEAKIFRIFDLSKNGSIYQKKKCRKLRTLIQLMIDKHFYLVLHELEYVATSAYDKYKSFPHIYIICTY